MQSSKRGIYMITGPLHDHICLSEPHGPVPPTLLHDTLYTGLHGLYGMCCLLSLHMVLSALSSLHVVAACAYVLAVGGEDSQYNFNMDRQVCAVSCHLHMVWSALSLDLLVSLSVPWFFASVGSMVLTSSFTLCFSPTRPWFASQRLS
jgi:hypothetical protein